MLGAAKHTDVICLIMRNSIPHLDFSLQKEIKTLIDDLKSILQLENDLKVSFGSLLPQVFNFRIKALQWISANDQNLLSHFDGVTHSFEPLLLDPHLNILGKSVIDALHQNQKVLNSLLYKNAISDSALSSSFSRIPDITYQHLLASISFSVPDSTAQKILDWINASLYIEAISLCAIVIYDEELNVSKNQINEMAYLIFDAGNECEKLSIESGLIRPIPASEHNRSEDAELLQGIQNLISTGSSFDFLKEDEELYSLSDLKKVYNDKG